MIKEMTNEEYHSKDAISKSGLDLIATSPAHYKAKYRSISPDVARLGTVIHSYILEGRKGCIVAPNISRSSKAGKEKWSDWYSDHGATVDTSKPAAEWHSQFERQTGLSVVSEKEEHGVIAMLESVKNNAKAVELLSSGQPETSIFNEYNGVQIRTRPDWMDADRSLIVDVKSTRSACEREFRRFVASHRYHVQDAMYSENYHREFGEWPRFVFIAVEKTPPYSCVVYELDLEAKANGHWLMNRDIETFKRCTESGEWPSYPDNLELSIPIYEHETFEYDLGDEVMSV